MTAAERVAKTQLDETATSSEGRWRRLLLS